jgi:hypothetical protein
MFRTLTIILCLLIGKLLVAQKQGGFENYHISNQTGWNAFMPVLHYETKQGLYLEARYNYDDLETFSVLAGKTFSFDKEKNYTITPMLGAAFGNLQGATLGVNMNATVHRFNFGTQSQYTYAFNDHSSSFIFTWAEASYQVGKTFYGGITMQHTKLYQSRSEYDPGFMLGFTHKNVSIPLYIFKPFKQERFVVLGIIWEWE